MPIDVMNQKKPKTKFIGKIKEAPQLGPSEKNLNNYYSLGDLTT